MSNKVDKRGFLAILAFLTFIIPLILTDEVSLLANWLFIYSSWSLIILLTALKLPQKK